MGGEIWLHLSELHAHEHEHLPMSHAHKHSHEEHHQHEHDFEWDGVEPHAQHIMRRCTTTIPISWTSTTATSIEAQPRWPSGPLARE